MSACDLLYWLRLLCLDVPLATAEPKRKIKIPETWPWARELEACFRSVFAFVPS
jgi:hypothetical protein